MGTLPAGDNACRGCQQPQPKIATVSKRSSLRASLTLRSVIARMRLSIVLKALRMICGGIS